MSLLMRSIWKACLWDTDTNTNTITLTSTNTSTNTDSDTNLPSLWASCAGCPSWWASGRLVAGTLSLTLLLSHALTLTLTLTPTYRLCEPLVLDVPVDEERLEGLSLELLLHHHLLVHLLSVLMQRLELGVQLLHVLLVPKKKTQNKQKEKTGHSKILIKGSLKHKYTMTSVDVYEAIHHKIITC